MGLDGNCENYHAAMETLENISRSIDKLKEIIEDESREAREKPEEVRPISDAVESLVAELNGKSVSILDSNKLRKSIRIALQTEAWRCWKILKDGNRSASARMIEKRHK